ncbi:MAG: type II toxin-antitoxin system RelE/ParE family toxin [Thermohalobaculum sp.]
MKYELSGRADSDLKEIYKYSYVSHGKAQADRYYEGLIARFEFLADAPLIAREHRDLKPPVRIHPYGRHLIAYQARDGRVLIVRVLHQSMDIESQL